MDVNVVYEGGQFITADSTQNCIIPGYYEYWPKPVDWSQAYQWPTTGIYVNGLPPYSRWTVVPDATQYVYRLDLPGVKIDKNFSLSIDAAWNLTCRSKRFDSAMFVSDTIMLAVNEIDVSEATATFEVCVLMVRFPLRSKHGPRQIHVEEV